MGGWDGEPTKIGMDRFRVNCQVGFMRLLNSDLVEYGWGGTVKCRGIPEARIMRDKLMEFYGIKTAEKEFYAYEEEPEWMYVLRVGVVRIEIRPATPSPGCIPEKRYNTSSSWVCVPKGVV